MHGSPSRTHRSRRNHSGRRHPRLRGRSTPLCLYSRLAHEPHHNHHGKTQRRPSLPIRRQNRRIRKQLYPLLPQSSCRRSGIDRPQPPSGSTRRTTARHHQILRLRRRPSSSRLVLEPRIPCRYKSPRPILRTHGGRLRLPPRRSHPHYFRHGQ